MMTIKNTIISPFNLLFLRDTLERIGGKRSGEYITLVFLRLPVKKMGHLELIAVDIRNRFDVQLKRICIAIKVVNLY